MAGADVMPLPDDVSTAVESLTTDMESAGKMVGATQVAAYPGEGVPGWIGESADAYTSSIKALGTHALDLSTRFQPAINALNTWSEAVKTARTTTIPDLHTEYDAAQTAYEQNIADLKTDIASRIGTDKAYSQTTISSLRLNFAEIRDTTQSDVLRRYREAIDNLDDDAQTAANSVQSAQNAVVDPSSASSRDQLGTTLFNDIPLVDGQAEWEYAQEVAPEAAAIVTKDTPSPDDVRAFADKYGDLCKNPFFAQALAERVTPEQLTQFLIRAELFRGQLVDKDGNLDTAYDATLDALATDLGSAVVLSTGGMNADPSMAQAQEAFSVARAGLMTNSHETVDSLIDTRLEQWKTTGNTLYDVTGKPLPQENYWGGTYGHHYGYEYLATMFSNAAVSNPNLALGPEFLTGDDSVAHDIVAFDHNHGGQIAQAGGYGNWGTTTKPPGGHIYLTDPVESMLRLMDEPDAFSDGSLTTSSPSWDTLSAANDARFDAVQTFLTDQTTFDVDASQEADRQPPVTLNGPMDMTRYLTSYRDQGIYYTGTQDFGDALGQVLAQAALIPDPPAGTEPGTPQYDTWYERDRRATQIAGNFLLGYQEGLEITDDTYRGQDGYGMQHAALRNWAGFILGNHIDGINDSFTLPANGSGPFTVDVPQGGNGHTLTLSQDLANRILGTSGGGNGLFTDLAFDAPTNDNGTPDDLSDDLSATGRNTALATLYTAATTSYQNDMSDALANGGFTDLPAVQDRWAPTLNALTASPHQADAEVGAAIDASNAHLKAMIQKGLGAIPFGNLIGEGHDVAKWMIDQTKGNLVPATLDHFLSEDNYNEATKEGVTAHQALEFGMQDSIYQVISTGNYWGDPPVTPQDFLNNHPSLKSFVTDGEVIPYSDMTDEQRSAFRQYVTGKDGLREYTLETFTRSGDALNHAETERQEALKDK